MNISVGLISHSFAWEQLLLQEGVPFTVVDLSRGLPADEVSVVAINRPIAGAEIAVIEQFLRHGGAVLGAAHHLEGVSGITSRQEWIEFLIPDGEEVLHGLSILDLGMMGSIPREANTLRTQGGTHAVFAGELDSGLAVVLPFDPESALVDMRVVGKSFYARRERLPGERVSLVAKGEIHHLIHAALEFLHHRRGIPYAHLWYFPGDAPSVFIFRIDTDNASTTDIEALYATSREFGIGMTWFLDVRSHQRWLEHFAAMTGQEIGVHCFEHRVFESYEENLRNIRRAREMLDCSAYARWVLRHRSEDGIRRLRRRWTALDFCTHQSSHSRMMRFRCTRRPAQVCSTLSRSRSIRFARAASRRSDIQKTKRLDTSLRGLTINCREMKRSSSITIPGREPGKRSGHSSR